MFSKEFLKRAWVPLTIAVLFPFAWTLVALLLVGNVPYAFGGIVITAIAAGVVHFIIGLFQIGGNAPPKNLGTIRSYLGFLAPIVLVLLGLITAAWSEPKSDQDSSGKVIATSRAVRRAENIELERKRKIEQIKRRNLNATVYTQEPLALGWQLCQPNQVMFDRSKPHREQFLVNAVYADSMTYRVSTGGSSLISGADSITIQTGLNDVVRRYVPTSARTGREVTVSLNGSGSVIHAVRQGQQRSNSFVGLNPTVFDNPESTVIRTERVCQSGQLIAWGTVPVEGGISSELTIIFLDAATGTYVPASTFTGQSIPTLGFAQVDANSPNPTAGNTSYDALVTGSVYTVHDVHTKAKEGDCLIIILPHSFPASTKILVNWKIN